MRVALLLAVCMCALPLRAAERSFSFSTSGDQPLPEGFASVLIGFGKQPDWRVVANAEGAEGGAVAQLSREIVNDRFPVLLLDETLSDFRLTVRFKIVDGTLEQSAGLVFRYNNPSNYYVIRADALRNSFRCYKVENGVVKPPIGPEMKVAQGEWHALLVECEGTRILCGLNGQEAVKLIDSSARRTGRIGFWTKSDTVAHFTGLSMTYKPHEPLARALVRDALHDFPRVMNLSLFARRSAAGDPIAVASSDPAEMGKAGSAAERKTLDAGETSFGRDRGSVTVVMPLRDRNGEPIAAVRVKMKSFPGQTEDNAVARARPVIAAMQGRAQSLEELID